MTAQPVPSIFLCSPLPSRTWWTPDLSIPWCCLPISFSLRLVFFPLSLYLTRWFWPELMNGRQQGVSLLCNNEQQKKKKKAHNVMYTSATHAGPCSWRHRLGQNGSAHGRVFENISKIDFQPTGPYINRKTVVSELFIAFPSTGLAMLLCWLVPKSTEILLWVYFLLHSHRQGWWCVFADWTLNRFKNCCECTFYCIPIDRVGDASLLTGP